VVYDEPACHHPRRREMEIFPDEAIDVVQACETWSRLRPGTWKLADLVLTPIAEEAEKFVRFVHHPRRTIVRFCFQQPATIGDKISKSRNYPGKTSIF
jgi:hypothetical protein